MLDYWSGGLDSKGFERCIGVRHRSYKWVGSQADKVYKFVNGSHVELPCNEVRCACSTVYVTVVGKGRRGGVRPLCRRGLCESWALWVAAGQCAGRQVGGQQRAGQGAHWTCSPFCQPLILPHTHCACLTSPRPQVYGQELKSMLPKMKAAAQAWWQQILDSAHSFTKQPQFLNYNGATTANVEAAAAVERTPGNIVVQPTGLSGFQSPGDASYWKVVMERPGRYDVSLVYASKSQASFRLALGKYEDIKGGKSATMEFTLPEKVQGQGAGGGGCACPASCMPCAPIVTAAASWCSR